ncbi:MAG: hypothetical protein LBT53_06390 [Puniceicoccales bacterium]|nr:hypothetical protein [Puniceicoccales bacterium]
MQDNTEKTTDSEKSIRHNAFDWTPSPWAELRKLRHGGDRTLARVVEDEVLTAAPATYPALEKKLLAVLAEKGATDVAKDFICRLLKVAGSEHCADALAPLLADENLSHSARFALEAIAGKKVDAALAAALPKLSGNARLGLLGTIAARKHAAAK